MSAQRERDRVCAPYRVAAEAHCHRVRSPGATAPLCAYPLHAHYKGQGNPEDASSFDFRWL